MNVKEWLGETNTLGIDIWNKKYRFNNETFDEWLDRVSGNDEHIKQLIIDKKFLFGGRILAGRGIIDKDSNKKTLSNCYVLPPVEDNLESIFERAGQLARTFSYGGGVGMDISKLAPRNARVRNAASKSSGSVSFMELYSLVTGLIAQNGRRGALLMSMDVSHPDIEEFITIKSDTNKVTKANVSVKITNEFMEAIEKDSDFELYYKRYETGEEIKRTVKAKALFALICQQAWDNAEPGVLFWDRINEYNLMQYDNNYKLAGTNPCVSGDTLLLTSRGYKPIKDVIDQEIEVWNGKDFTLSTPQITGYNQPMLRITLDDGCSVECTDYHKFILDNDKRVEARELKIGQKLAKSKRWPLIEGMKEIPKKTAYTQGFFMGDGAEHRDSNRRSIWLYGEKRDLIKYLDFNSSCLNLSNDTRDCLNLERNPALYNKNFVPDASYTIKTRLAWLAGYIDSDGCVNSEEGSISISSVNFDVLMKVKLMLNTLGANGKIGVMKEECDKLMPANDGTGGMKLCHCQRCYRIVISAYNVKILKKIGLKTHRVSLKSDPNRDAGRFPRVISIEKIPDADVVYCLNEKGNHSVIFNGVYSSQCGELPLPAGGACLLGSINLAEFVTEDKTFDFEDFRTVVCTAIHALDKVLDEGIMLHPLQIQRNSAEVWRPIGLGIMGLADMLIKMEIVYGSQESIDLCSEIGNIMARSAISQSIEDAERHGEFPNCDRKAILASNFFKIHAHPTDGSKLIESGIRNSQLLTIPPTGSLANMLGISNGIEPIFDKYYIRKTETLNDEEKFYRIYTQIVWDYMQKNGIKEGEEDKLPEYFVTAKEIPYKDRIRMQGVWQSHIDNSISSTVNLPNNTSVEDVMDLYMTAWKEGLKGVTVFREGCKRVPILDSGKKKEEKPYASIIEQEYVRPLKEVREELMNRWLKGIIDPSPLRPEVKEDRTLKRGEVIKAPANSIGKKRDLMTGCGSLHFQAFFDQECGNVVETYLSKGSKGGCNSFMIGLSRMISLAGRAGVDIHTIADQLQSAPACTSYAARRASKHDTSKGICCPGAVGYALIEMYEEVQEELEFGGVYKGSPLYYKMKAEREKEKADKEIIPKMDWEEHDSINTLIPPQTSKLADALLSIPGLNEVFSNMSDEDVNRALNSIYSASYDSLGKKMDCSICQKDCNNGTDEESEIDPVPKEVRDMLAKDLAEKMDAKIYDWINEGNNREKSARLFSALMDHPYFIAQLTESIRKGGITSLEDLMKKIDHGLKPVGMGSISPLFADIQDDLKDHYANTVGLCPECGAPLTFEGGCNTCKVCGWSKCD